MILYFACKINTTIKEYFMDNYPLVSILSTFKDSKEMLKIVVDSILSQDYPNVEHIIMDSASNDGSVELLKEYNEKYSEKKYSLVWKSESDRCIADGANKAAALMTGDFFIFITNPFVSIESLSTLMRVLIDGNYDAVCGGVVFQRNGTVVRRWRGNKWSWRLGWMAANETLCLKKEIFDSHGPFSENFSASFDYNFQLSVFMDKKYHIKAIQVPIINFFAGGISNDGISGNIKTIKEDYAAIKAHKIKFAWFTILCKCIAAFLAYTFISKKDKSTLIPS